MALCFENFHRDGPAIMPIVVRPDIDAAGARRVLDLIDAVDWAGLSHAYGPAADVPAQLMAVTVGDAVTRRPAWSSLTCNVWHQHSVYPATVPSVAVFAALAGWQAYPDRVDALSLLREIARGEGPALPKVLAAVDADVPPLFTGWRDEPELVRRALLWLLTSLPELRERYADLVAETLPAEHREGWELAIADSWAEDGSDDDQYERVCQLEEWAWAGILL